MAFFWIGFVHKFTVQNRGMILCRCPFWNLHNLRGDYQLHPMAVNLTFYLLSCFFPHATT